MSALVHRYEIRAVLIKLLNYICLSEFFNDAPIMVVDNI